MRRIWVTVTILLLAMATTAFAQTSATGDRNNATLRYKFTKDEVDRYSFAATIKITGSNTPAGDRPSSGSMSMNVNILMRQRVLDALPDGSAKMRYWVGQFETIGPNAPKVDENMVKGIIIHATKAEDGRILDIEGVENPPGTKAEIPFDINQFGQLLSYQLGALPAKPVAAGDSWTQMIELPLSMGKLDSTATLAQTGVATAAGPASKIHQEFKGHLDFSKLDGSGGKPGGPAGRGTGNPPDSGAGSPGDTGTGGPADRGTGGPPDSGAGNPPDSGTGGPPDSGAGNPPNNGTGGPPDSGTRRPEDRGPEMNVGASISGSTDLLFSNRLGKLIASDSRIVLDFTPPKPAESAAAESRPQGKGDISKIEVTLKVTRLK